ncbi:hypothetical protein MNBD_GAMMA22-1376 [hydrothermal vent metagenome]|uniref:Outer membrane protein assembly factor BamC n=1 Tax=hydrothermal vent metagenome TaxID=652676 RepID=A0A3B1AY35_9ZZZZ
MFYVYTRMKVVFFIFSILLLLISCSTSDKKAVYEDVATEKPLIVPPDIVMPSQNSSLSVPEIAPQSTTYKIYSQKNSNNSNELLKDRTTGIRLLRDGAIRWLEIDAQPKDIWNKAIDYFQRTGFSIKIKKPKLGIIETNWLENKANVPTNWFSQMFKNMYRNQKDRYRVRLERNSADTRTLMFLTHRAGIEKEIDTDDEETELMWVPLASDPELEAEMLQRFLVYLGNDETDIANLFSGSAPQKRTTIVETDGQIKYLKVKEIFSRTWRRTGLAIDRLGFTVDDKDRSAGIYYIKVSKVFIETELNNGGFFSNLFSEKHQDITQFLISLEDKKTETHIQVLTRQGHENKSPLQKLIVEKLDKLLK